MTKKKRIKQRNKPLKFTETPLAMHLSKLFTSPSLAKA